MLVRFICCLMFVFQVSMCYGYNSYDSLDRMQRENEERMERAMDRIREEQHLSEIRRMNDEQERYNRHTINKQRTKLFGR